MSSPPGADAPVPAQHSALVAALGGGAASHAEGERGHHARDDDGHDDGDLEAQRRSSQTKAHSHADTVPDLEADGAARKPASLLSAAGGAPALASSSGARGSGSSVNGAGGAVVKPARARRGGRLGRLRASLRARLAEDVLQENASLPLGIHCFVTGAVDAIVYKRTGIWSAFQTGNMVQFSQNIAQYVLPSSPARVREPLATLERAVVVASFFLSSFVGAHLARRMGAKRRAWLVTSSCIQAACLFGSAGILLHLPTPFVPSFRWAPPMLAMTTFSMGLQSITAQLLASPPWATTVAYTATLTQLAADPYLFALSNPIPSFSSSASTHARGAAPSAGRDRRFASIVLLCLGAGVAESWLTATRLDFEYSMLLCAAVKCLLALSWLVPAGKKSSLPSPAPAA